MNIHTIVSNKISSFFENIYLKYKVYNKNRNNKILNLKLESLIYLQYYFIYTFLYYVTNNNFILYSTSLHFIYICELIFKNLSDRYKYYYKNNVIEFFSSSYLLFLYFLFLKISFLKIYFYSKIFLLSSLSLFYLLITVNDTYKKRLESIHTNKDFYHPLKIIIFTPDKKVIQNIIEKTNFFTYSNFLLLVNFLFLFIK